METKALEEYIKKVARVNSVDFGGEKKKITVVFTCDDGYDYSATGYGTLKQEKPRLMKLVVKAVCNGNHPVTIRNK